ncbi:hypothetical protein PoB_005314300 [Plakobranchus ocellatus]|uniref:Uncharacterized protein n=1 Tax=Plakobranchus ocellatus TaxID=259542 RepID=A0AAV4C6M2_9GAST|nr:hypothetical protein PoB_005314300 [Plakobranchus ocellatus]
MPHSENVKVREAMEGHGNVEEDCGTRQEDKVTSDGRPQRAWRKIVEDDKKMKSLAMEDHGESGGRLWKTTRR